MCARYLLDISPAYLNVWLQLVESADWTPPLDCLPTTSAPVVLHSRRRDGPMSSLMRFGLVPHWAPDARTGRRLINARAESAEGSRAFGDSLTRRRALIPASAFIEWTGPAGARIPQRIAPPTTGEPMLLAGIWASWIPPDQRHLPAADTEPLRTFCIFTTDARQPVRSLHDRMPVLVHPASANDWLTGALPLADLLRHTDALSQTLHITPLHSELR
jgi:putative SOS response-associated peptidase YedK